MYCIAGGISVGMSSSRKNGAPHVYTKLKQLVMNYRIAPGRHLHPSDFVQSMKVSATPIRDAMHRLSGEHLLVFTPSKGFFSKALDLAEMRELIDLQLILLRYALSRAKRRPAARDIARETTPDLLSVVALCQAFENVVTEAAALSESRCLIQLLGNLIDRTHFITALD